MSGAGMAGVTYYASNEDDPYVTLKNPVSQIKHCFVLCIVCVCVFFCYFNAVVQHVANCGSAPFVTTHMFCTSRDIPVS